MAECFPALSRGGRGALNTQVASSQIVHLAAGYCARGLTLTIEEQFINREAHISCDRDWYHTNWVHNLCEFKSNSRWTGVPLWSIIRQVSRRTIVSGNNRVIFHSQTELCSIKLCRIILYQKHISRLCYTRKSFSLVERSHYCSHWIPGWWNTTTNCCWKMKGCVAAAAAASAPAPRAVTMRCRYSRVFQVSH